MFRVTANLSTGRGAPGAERATGAAAARTAFHREYVLDLTDKLSQKSDELQAGYERLSALIELSARLASELDSRRLIESFVHAIPQIVGVRIAVAAILEGGKARFEYLRSSETVCGTADPNSLDPAAAPLDGILRQGRAIRLRYPAGNAWALGLPASGPALDSWLGVPIASPTRIYGFLGLADKRGGAGFTEEDERQMRMLGEQVGRIYQNAILYSEAMARAAALEREMAAREIAGRALAGRERHMRLLLDSTAEAIYTTDLQGNCTFANAACLRALGYFDAGELMGREMDSLILHTPGDSSLGPEEGPILDAGPRNGQMHVDDAVLWRADRTSFPAEYWSDPVFRAGQPIGTVVTFVDATRRRELDGQFRRAHRRLPDIVRLSPSVLFTLALGKNGIKGISWVSDNMPAAFGHAPEAVLGAGWWMANVHEDDLERTIAGANRELFSRDRSKQELRFRDGAGSYRWARCDLRLLRDPSGRPVEVVGACLDISERKRAEEQQSELRRQALEARNPENIGRLAGEVAHDFNNLLTVINGYSNLLVKGLPLDGRMRDMAAQIGIAGQRAAELTKQLALLGSQPAAGTGG